MPVFLWLWVTDYVLLRRAAQDQPLPETAQRLMGIRISFPLSPLSYAAKRLYVERLQASA